MIVTSPASRPGRPRRPRSSIIVGPALSYPGARLTRRNEPGAMTRVQFPWRSTPETIARLATAEHERLFLWVTVARRRRGRVMLSHLSARSIDVFISPKSVVQIHYFLGIRGRTVRTETRFLLLRRGPR
ncbi:hypothetical protein EVAR_76736_1 [Eumeta japonica]|uniref:Uncharacterized protein n=1 Tax=Eumeta variegata TaxID=151549 RepID=A0A4C1SVN1_EUMVA|nr:hypothetical protein EVAR_76736_1 [Eumeta japonica]